MINDMEDTARVAPHRLVYIECGTTANSLVNTGIQRVVRNIVNHSAGVASKFDLEMATVAFVNGNFYPISSELRKVVHNKAPDSAASSSGFPLALINILKKIDGLTRKLCRYRFYDNLRNFIKSKLKPAEIEGQESQSREYRLQPVSEKGIPSVLLLLDSTWDNSIWKQVDEFRAGGGVVCAVLYDLIPFLHPETVAELTRIAHTSWWANAPAHLDSVMCISQTVRDDFLLWQESQKLPVKLSPDRVDYFYLGSEIALGDDVVKLLMSEQPLFLMVGSIEPRKNHKTVMDAFELLWESGVEVSLVIVGSYGWKSEKLIERINKHPKLNSSLFLIRDASDRDLAAMYNKADSLIIASIAEGFGLPIVEAFQHNTDVICSDIPVFREVAGDFARYFEVLEPQSLVDQVEGRLLELHQHSSVLPARHDAWINWDQSAFQLFEKITKSL